MAIHQLSNETMANMTTLNVMCVAIFDNAFFLFFFFSRLLYALVNCYGHLKGSDVVIDPKLLSRGFYIFIEIG